MPQPTRYDRSFDTAALTRAEELAARSLAPDDYLKFEGHIADLKKIVKRRKWDIDPDPHDDWVTTEPLVPPNRDASPSCKGRARARAKRLNQTTAPDDLTPRRPLLSS